MPSRQLADPNPDPDRGPVPVVPGYVLEERLGRGGSGEVWRARPRSGGPKVAVKVLLRGDPDRQTREAELLGQLDHPHLVALHEVVRREVRGGAAQVSLVLDLLEGGSLAQLLARRGRLRPGEVVTAVAPVAAALAHAHERGIVHGDLAPGNVVFTAEGRPVLTDLGVGRVLGEAAAGEVTPPYVDPVVARGGAPGPASDVFGVAAAAFHALTGIPPWNAAGPADTLAVAAAGEVPDLALLAPDAPAELVDVVTRGLSPHPHLRGSAAAFALDLRHACRPERIALPRPGVDDADLALTGQVPRTELTHQVRRPPGAHAAPLPRGRVARWRRRLVPAGPRGVDVGRLAAGIRRVAVGLVTVAALLGAVWVGVLWGGSARIEPVPAARAGEAPAPATPAVPATPATPAGPAGSDPTSTASPSATGTRTDAPAENSTPVGTAGPTSSSPTPASGGDGDPGGGETPADRQETPPDDPGWQAVLEALYARRAEAFTTGRPELLTGVFTTDSPMLAQDTSRLSEVLGSGATLESFAPRVVSIQRTEITPDGSAARVDLVDEVPGYAITPADGGTTQVAARARATVTMTLSRTAEGWRIGTATLTG